MGQLLISGPDQEESVFFGSPLGSIDVPDIAAELGVRGIPSGVRDDVDRREASSITAKLEPFEDEPAPGEGRPKPEDPEEKDGSEGDSEKSAQ